jgi:hypothetical protein
VRATFLEFALAVDNVSFQRSVSIAVIACAPQKVQPTDIRSNLSRPADVSHRWVIHDRDGIYSEDVDATVAAMGLTILETPAMVIDPAAALAWLVGRLRSDIDPT